MRYVAFCILTIAWFSSCKNESSNAVSGGPLFHLLSPAETGVDFANDVADKDSFNILTYRNFYNGGGVAIGDVNGDSLPDLFFTSNQHKNRLYLNKGKFHFEDITDKAGVGGIMSWSTGATMADVNGDGLLDIYVCNSGDVAGNNKKNELYINNGNLTFTEKGREYNLDNEGYSTHAAFFDYDGDGDLDCYILNNSFRNPGRIELYRKMREQPSPGGHRLMRNDGNTFTDVTSQAGIYGSDIAFGLGVAVSDLNGDNLPDIYVSNDFWERDYLYINQGNGKFSEELPQRVNYCSTSSMGADIADLNNDGYPDVFTTDMLPADNYRLKTTMTFDPYHLEDMKYRANYHYQITQNCLQLNNGRGDFAEVAQLAGVDATDWSWGALIFDFENDGNKDIFVSNGVLKDMMSMDFLEFYSDQQRTLNTNAQGKLDYLKFISQIPSDSLQNYAFENEGNLVFKNKASQLGLTERSFSNGAAYGDLDNDGDMDLVVNNNDATCFIYRNDAGSTSGNNYLKVRFHGTAKNIFGIGATVRLSINGRKEVLQNFNTRGFQSSVEPSLLFGVGKDTRIDSVQVTWPDGKEQLLQNIKANQALTLKYTDAHAAPKTIPRIIPLFTSSRQMMDPAAVHHEDRYDDFNNEILLFRLLSTEGPRLITGDVNNDKLTDFILTGAAGDADKLFLQHADGSFHFEKNSSFVRDAGFESTCGALFDYDKDGDLDLVIGSGGNEIEMPKNNYLVRLYLNDGKGNFTADPSAIPPVIGNFSTIEAADFDQDGDVDLFLGARNVPGNYGLSPRSYLLVNDNGTWRDVAPASLGNIGMVTDASWSDIDGDGDQDLLVVGDWMGIHIFRNENGVLQDPIIIPNSNGWWTRIEAADLDQDGDIDFVLGNWGLNTKFKASPGRPLSMFVNDFDNNGKSEFIINWYPRLDSISYPFATKPEITSQMPGLRKQILKYLDYGNKTYETLFTPEQRSTSLQYEANMLQSAVLWNNNGIFELKPLPLEAQFSPVFGIVTGDMDSDGNSDIWLGGNFYGLKPQAGRHDASKGAFLKGNGDHTFSFIPNGKAGIEIEGEVRDATFLKSSSGGKLIIARNNEKVLMFSLNK